MQMMLRTRYLFLVVFLIMAAGCKQPEPQPVRYPQAVTAAVRMATAVSSVANPEIRVLSFRGTIWKDQCLGVPQPDETCQPGATPGWIVVLDGPGGAFEVHTDQLGEKMRFVR